MMMINQKDVSTKAFSAYQKCQKCKTPKNLYCLQFMQDD